jgi:uncharacterized protein (DUF433 family)
VAARPLGQRAVPVILDLGPIVEGLERAVQDLPRRTADQVGQVTRDRLIMDGRDIIAGTRIPTATIAWSHRQGYTVAEILEDFPRLTATDIAAALAHEARKQAQAGELAAAG